MSSTTCEIPFVLLGSFVSAVAGSKAMDYSNGLFDCQSPTSPFLGGLRVLHLLEDLRAALELMDNEERGNLRCQIPDSTAEGLAEWLHGRLVKRRRVSIPPVCHLSDLVAPKGVADVLSFNRSQRFNFLLSLNINV